MFVRPQVVALVHRHGMQHTQGHAHAIKHDTRADFVFFQQRVSGPALYKTEDQHGVTGGGIDGGEPVRLAIGVVQRGGKAGGLVAVLLEVVLHASLRFDKSRLVPVAYFKADGGSLVKVDAVIGATEPPCQ